MKTHLFSLAIATMLTGGAAQAASDLESGRQPEAHHKQALGVGVGSVAGALIAGPAGLVVGGIAGSLIGWSEGLQSDLDTSHRELAKSRAELATLETRNSLRVAQASDTLPLYTGSEPPSLVLSKAIKPDLSLDIYFRSGSATIEPYYATRLAAIADFLDAFPALDIELSGFADRRGTDEDNVRLSTERVHAVKTALIADGIDAQRIRERPLGESRPVSKAGDAQAYPFDRRVQIVMSVRETGAEIPVAMREATPGQAQ
jgi:outer membrane protein OmpA-like peptidoglycan-associated protein